MVFEEPYNRASILDKALSRTPLGGKKTIQRTLEEPRVYILCNNKGFLTFSLAVMNETNLPVWKHSFTGTLKKKKDLEHFRFFVLWENP